MPVFIQRQVRALLGGTTAFSAKDHAAIYVGHVLREYMAVGIDGEWLVSDASPYQSADAAANHLRHCRVQRRRGRQKKRTPQRTSSAAAVLLLVHACRSDDVITLPVRYARGVVPGRCVLWKVKEPPAICRHARCQTMSQPCFAR